MSIDRWMDKDVVCMCIYYIRNTTQPAKEWNNAFSATWVDLEIIILYEVNQSDKDKYHVMSLICGIFKNDTHELIYKTEIYPQT